MPADHSGESRPSEPTADAAEHSQLRFAFFLQIAAAVILLAATIIRVTHRHVDVITLICALGAIGAFGFAAFTRSRLQR